MVDKEPSPHLRVLLTNFSDLVKDFCGLSARHAGIYV